jgi:hypothetical protein
LRTRSGSAPLLAIRLTRSGSAPLLAIRLTRSGSAPLLDISKLADRREIVWSCFEDVLELHDCLVVASHFEQGATERDASGEIGGMLRQTGPAHSNGFVELACTSMLFCELRKGNRRRILLDPASKFFNP